MPPNDSDGPAPARHAPWMIGWRVVAPLAAWLVFAKLCKITAMEHFWSGPSRGGVLAHAAWLSQFVWFRLAVAVALALAVQRLWFRRRAWLAPLLVLLQFGAMFAWLGMRTGDDPLERAQLWGLALAHELNILASALWREAATVALLALVLGGLLRWGSGRSRLWSLRAAEAAVILLCLLTGIDLAYELATGQASSARVLLFSSSNWRDTAPMVASEATPFRLFCVVAAVVLPLAWAAHWRRVDPDRSVATAPPSRRGLAAALVGALTLLLPVLPANTLPFERFSQGTLIAFARTLASSDMLDAHRRVLAEFSRENRPRWHSAGLKLVATPASRRSNVVFILLESVRASSTTLFRPDLDSTPYLRHLATQGLQVRDMSAVIPRTAGAWMAVLGGQYPLTNEGTKGWSAENAKVGRVRGLPAALRELGYATAFFVPTDLRLLNEVEVVRSLGFDTIVAEHDLARPGLERANYNGLADDVMVAPVLEWTAAQARASRPFLLTVMTNVGHHPYTTPSTWTPRRFPGVSDPSLAAYLNCLRYLDGIVETLIRGFEQQGLRDDTVFIVLGDHGQFFGEHGVKQSFNSLYQEGLHVPAVIYAPGLLPHPGVIEGPRQQVDFVPTVAELLGLRIEGARLPGVSLLQDVDPKRTLFFSSSIDSSYLALRRGSVKYVYDFDRNPMEVYDLASDPAEQHPLQAPADEVGNARRDLIEWAAASELSMYARPAVAADPQGRWLQR